MNKIKLSVILISSSILFTTNSFAIGMTAADYSVAKIATDTKQWMVEKAENTAQWGVESGFHESLTELSLENQVLSTQAGLNGNKAYDTALTQASKLGGAYGDDMKGMMESCFNIDLPDFSKMLGLNGMSFCGMDGIKGMYNTAMKDKSGTVQKENINKVTEKKDLTNEQEAVVYGKVDSSKNNCNELQDESCKDKVKESVKYEKEHGVDQYGDSSTNAVKAMASKTNSEINPENKQDIEDKVCVNNELINGTTEGYSCKKDILQDLEKQEKTNSEISNNTSKLIDASERDVRENMLNANESFAESVTSRINTSREIRNDYNIRYNPNTVVFKDVETMGENSFYKRNAEYLTNDPTLYIVPTLKDKEFTIGKFGLDNYKEASIQFGKLKIEDVDGNVLEDSSSIKATIDRLGGVTPFTSALYGYDVSLSVMAKSIYDGTSAKSGEQGEIGREMAIINGLKGTMYQSMLINQQLENQNRANYNIRIKEFDKISQDNDNINNKLEQIQNQNALVIDLLKEMNVSLKKIANK